MIKDQSKLYGLDHLRALAIILVLLFHYKNFNHPEWINGFTDTGWTGVDLFFVLSGFLIASQLFAQIKKGKAISLQTFFLKRLFRIIPVYVVVVALYFCIPFFREKEALPPLWKFLTFTQNFGLDRNNHGTFSHAWSLCVEEHFYLFLPFILVALQYTNSFKRAYWIIIFLFIAGFALRLYSWHYLYLPSKEWNTGIDYWGMFSYYPTYNRLDGLLVGVSIAGIYQFLPQWWQRMARYGNWLILLGAIILALCFQYCSKLYEYNTSLYGYTLISIGYGFMVAGALSPVSFLYRWKSSITTFIATLSYGMYLSHKGIIHMTQVVFGDWGVEKSSIAMLLICVLLSIAGAWFLHLVIQKPFMKWRDVVLKKKQVLNVL
jgi:peptidoglycan/LPS O-acetylase OafA/YrhL